MIEPTCLQCGNVFVLNSRARGHVKFCSKLCGERHRKPKRKHIEKQCEVCRSPFTTRGKAPSRERFCTTKCRQRFYNVAFNRKKYPPRELSCEVCEKIIHTYRQEQKTCSDKCNDKVQNLRRKKALHRILERDNFTCQHCGKHGQRLAVHHKDGSGETDNPNHDDKNLTSVCYKCHKIVHTINYLVKDGELFVIGKIFDVMGVNEVKVLRESGA